MYISIHEVQRVGGRIGAAYQSSGCVDACCPCIRAVHPRRLRKAEEAVRRHVALCVLVFVGYFEVWWGAQRKL